MVHVPAQDELRAPPVCRGRPIFSAISQGILSVLSDGACIIETVSFSFADLSLDSVSHEARRGTRSFALTPTEFELSRLFMHHPRQVLERRLILANVWGHHFQGDDNIIEVYVGYLRKKTEAGGEPRLIQTVRGVGYVLREEA
jgi:DNA-binding response OmpR family regulator